jgi:7-carboxy-7-deazaguanine synthase
VSYVVKEIYYTLQGEGINAGRPAVFLRFAGCNLWTGREADRAGAVCQFCDTDFVGTDGPAGGKFDQPRDLARAAAAQWPETMALCGRPLLVCTGGEPGLQLDSSLVEEFHREGFEVAVETNGTTPLPDGIDWVCVSPKAGSTTVVTQGNELKLVYPQSGAEPALFEHFAFDHFLLQPMDGPSAAENLGLALQYCLAHPRWRLSLQTHKLLRIP